MTLTFVKILLVKVLCVLHLSKIFPVKFLHYMITSWLILMYTYVVTVLEIADRIVRIFYLYKNFMSGKSPLFPDDILSPVLI